MNKWTFFKEIYKLCNRSNSFQVTFKFDVYNQVRPNMDVNNLFFKL